MLDTKNLGTKTTVWTKDFRSKNITTGVWQWKSCYYSCHCSGCRDWSWVPGVSGNVEQVVDVIVDGGIPTL